MTPPNARQQQHRRRVRACAFSRVSRAHALSPPACARDREPSGADAAQRLATVADADTRTCRPRALGANFARRIRRARARAPAGRRRAALTHAHVNRALMSRCARTLRRRQPARAAERRAEPTQLSGSPPWPRLRRCRSGSGARVQPNHAQPFGKASFIVVRSFQQT